MSKGLPEVSQSEVDFPDVIFLEVVPFQEVDDCSPNESQFLLVVSLEGRDYPFQFVSMGLGWSS